MEPPSPHTFTPTPARDNLSLEPRLALIERALLRLYALFKQGSKGDAEGKRPGRFDMVNRAKYDAWAKVAGTSSADAKQS
ncbi:acyl-CoA-binding protein [Rhodococcus opacus]|uniref:Acyl-CoA-binding protein n=1 Tax=Rhodococcus opacus TaxID=37919 RepID=A0A2S8IJW1_RHOOP|nr:acyl-CoA-binding protein [Rhodococcus opacus]PQP15060.1 acyl-CoA-binding protein [Rhodococcus opacus]